MIRFGRDPLKRTLLCAALTAALLISLIALSACSCANSVFGSVSPSPEPDEEPPAVAEQTESQTPETASPTPSAEPTESVEPTESPEPTKPLGPSVPWCDPADDEFFSDAAFMGNSLMNGFELYTGLTTPDYYTATSMSVIGAQSTLCVTLDNGTVGTMVDALCQKPYAKIYIFLGINEIGLAVEDFIASYATMLDTVIAAQPECDIYIMSLTPVSQAKDASGQVFNMTRIYAYNTALYELAAQKGVYYLDLVTPLAGADGFLPADKTFDGVHFTADLYQVWLEYVRTHHV